MKTSKDGRNEQPPVDFSDHGQRQNQKKLNEAMGAARLSVNDGRFNIGCNNYLTLIASVIR